MKTRAPRLLKQSTAAHGAGGECACPGASSASDIELKKLPHKEAPSQAVSQFDSFLGGVPSFGSFKGSLKAARGGSLKGAHTGTHNPG